MKPLFLIATCERPEMLKSLLLQIHTLCPFETDVCVVDDASEADYTEVIDLIDKYDDWYYRFDQRRGRKGYWEVVDLLFSEARGRDFDYVYKLDDDVEIHPQVFQESTPMLEKLNQYYKKVVLNLWVDHRADQRIWTGVTPRITTFGDMKIRKVGWVDGGNWAASRKCLEAIDWSCPQPPEQWWKTAGDSSGVGKYLSIELNKKACRIYMPMKSFVYHGSHDSVMHKHKNDMQDRPIEMKQKPWE